MIPIDEVCHFDVATHDPATGAVSDADSAPTFDVFEEATDAPILDDQTMTKRTSLTGNYRGTFTASAANGFEAGKWYSVVVTAVVGGITAKAVAKNFRVAPAEASAGVPLARAESLSTQAKADVNAEVLDVLNVDTFAEPGQEAPGATISLAKKIGFLYKNWRNRQTSSSTEIRLYGDDATTIDQKWEHSDNGATYDKGEAQTGP